LLTLGPIGSDRRKREEREKRDKRETGSSPTYNGRVRREEYIGDQLINSI